MANLTVPDHWENNVGIPRYTIINTFVAQRNFHSFLEIGTFRGETFRAVNCDRKVSVDPDLSTDATYHMTSDAFFLQCDESFDIVFVDGCHICEQVYRDVRNSLEHLNRNGIIVMHDCLPLSYTMQVRTGRTPPGRPWFGDVWKAYVKARAELPYDVYCIPEDMGCGIIDTSLTRTTDVSDLPTDMTTMTYHDFVAHPEWMNIRRPYKIGEDMPPDDTEWRAETMKDER